MKKFIFLFTVLVAVSASVSCTREVAHEGVAPVSESGLVTFNVGVSTVRTKVTDTTGISEEAVKTLQIFVFSEGGEGLEKTVYDDTGLLNVEMSCFPGIKEVVAIVNAPEIKWDEIDSVEDFSSDDMMTYLTDNSFDKFFMYGAVEANVAANTTVNVDVSRRVARVVLRSVETPIPSGSSVGNFVGNAVYLINVAGDSPYSGSEDYTPKVWYNESGLDDGDDVDLESHPYDFLYDEIGTRYIAIGQHTFYCYPNPTDQPTRLVVDANLNGRRWYYPVTIENVMANHSYEVYLTITGAGADSPDTDPQVSDFQFIVNVSPWEVEGFEKTI